MRLGTVGEKRGKDMVTKDRMLFHYTSLQGLLGITESASIWATNILYLNDASELLYAKDLLKEELTVFRKTNEGFAKTDTLDKSLGHFFLESFEDNINTLLPSQTIGIFVCSFSEEGDLLSQWRGYSRTGQGFSLGFSLDRLKVLVESARFSIKKVIYDRDEQISEIQKLLSDLAKRFADDVGNSVDKKRAWDEKAKRLLSDVMLEFIKLAPLLKHPKFAEEKEWRIMAALKTKQGSRAIKFRAGTSMVVPYLEVPLSLQSENLIIDEINVGPTIERALSAASVEMLLKSQNIVCPAVSCSTIPFRAT
ncbi:hypothetical protein Gura_0798 [Geotalea uraniireducens Rf4]|uniref:DUF2971 domain-containing protein n=2 Tax=Geotalea uraniireducens TaxID=351604 RepID=A5GBP6_GEOUR|nr:hypothetical protein Gura_0798 [Geotalea uraniireducens Rf4]